ncbi:PKD-like domain-containing protein [Marivirga salinae]|uniref:PKD-like domain-containing protein n=1 Tax=Marivirga salinarum TaxID=3059078 RepID=A0AA51N9T1_9BACT|nr:PKD-like domain-containing protein [Marivirga sp. BDSF4-3]WMN11344.1 PKD-like domain-containing protein [Marivirga sp. BDSF4-3]
MPSNFEFNTSVGNITFADPNSDFSVTPAASYNGTSNSIEIAWNVDNTISRNSVTLFNLEIRAVAGAASGDISRTSSTTGTDATINNVPVSPSTVFGTLYGYNDPAIIGDPLPTPVCENGNTSFSVTTSDVTSYQWQVDEGSGFSDITTGGGIYSNYNSSELLISNAPLGISGNSYRVVVQGICSPIVTSNPATLTVNPIPAAPTVTPQYQEYCIDDFATFVLPVASGSGGTFKWYDDAELNNLIHTGPATADSDIGFNSNSTGTYTAYVTETSAQGCESEATKVDLYVKLPPNDSPSLNPTPTTTSPSAPSVCDGGQLTFTINTAYSFNSYQLIDESENPLSAIVNGNGASLDITSLPFNRSTLGSSELVRVRVTRNDTGCSVILLDSPNRNTITINAPPVVALNSDDLDNTICSGSPIEFTASGANDTYEFFVNGASVQGPIAATKYSTSSLVNGDQVTVVGTNTTGCSDTSAPITVTVQSPPGQPTISSASATECLGTSITLTSSVAPGTTEGTYRWYQDGTEVIGETSQAIVLNTVAESGSYTVEVTNGDNTAICYSAPSIAFDATINPLPTVTLTSSEADNRICAGDAVTFTASGATDYEFFVDGLSVQASSTTATYTTSALADGEVVTVEGIDGNSCVATSSGITTSVDPLPTVVLTSSDADNEICNGDAVTFTASGATNYEFFVDGGSVQASSTDNTYTTSALADGEVMTVEGIDANSCSATSSPINMTVNSLPVVTLSGSATEICAGDAVTYTAGGATNYEFFIDGISVQGPNTTATYTTSSLSNAQVVSVEGTDGNTCSATATEAAITVNSLPTVTLTSSEADNRICAGDAVTFTASGATDYEFFVDGLSVQASSTTATYTTSALADGEVVTVEGIDGNSCVATSSGITTTVDPLPTVVLTSSDADNEICNGDAVTFTASGATNYEFFVDGGSVQASSTDNTYTTSALADGEVVTVEGIDANSCSATSSPINMTVNSLPVVTLSGSATEICAGDAVTYTAGGATNYEFFIDGISVQGPNTTATYTTSSLSNAQVVSVEGTDGNTCSATATEAAITVNSLPTVTLTSSEADNRICAGDAVTFTASGATDYEFFVDGLSVQASSTTATYTTSALADGEVVTVEGIDGNSCVATSSGITTSVDPLPTVVLTSSDADNEICNGDAVTFTASGATNYEFFVDGGSVQASSTDNTYTTSALADGEVVTVEGIDANSCSATSSPINMTVNSLPVVTLSGSATEICAGDAVTYTAGGATNYEFFIDGISVQGPNTTATYTTSSLSNAQVVSVEGTDGNTCSATATEAAITVNSLPTVTLTSSEADNRICAGDAVTFTASGATDYEFFVDGLSVQASSTTATYTTSALADGEVVTVEGIDGNSCVATSSGITTSVDPLPTVVLTSSDADNEICNGDAVTFTASGATNYEFFVDGGSVQASSTDNTYTTSALADGEVVTVEGIDANSCSATSSPINMTVNSLPVVTLSGSATEICAGDAVTYTAGGATNYEFFIDGISVQGPNTTATYTTSSLSNAQVVSVEGTDGNTCSATATEAAITVNSLPTVTLTSSEADNRICAGDAVTFTASGATDYEFFVDGLSVQASSTTATYTTSALADGEVVTVEGIDGNSCVATSSGITTSVDPLPTVVLTSSDADNEICNGDAVTFTASGATNYEFFVDGGSVQASSTDNTYTTSALADGEVVTVEGIDANSCSATSSPINMTVNSLPVVTLSGSATEICAGDAVTYTAGGATNYEFFIDGISVQGPNTNATYTTSSLSNAQVVSVEGTDGNTCSATATEAAITVNSLPTVTLTSSEADNRICAGDAVTFTASGATDYEFFVDGLSVQASSTTATYTTSALADGEVVTVEGIDGNSCVATSSGITTSVDPLPTVVLTSSDADNEICNGDAVTFTASGATNYEFFVDGGSVQASSTDNTYTTSALADGEVVTVEGIDANSCSATSSPINMTVNSLPVVTLSGSATEICAGDAVTYTAGGATNYEFFIDGISVQGPNTTATYTTSSLSNAQVVSVEGTDGNTCSATATEAAITVNSLPTVTLTSSEADNRICAGDAVTFTASGATDYEFFVDGLSVQASSTTATYTTSALADGEVVTVEGIDGNSCVATSSGITTSVDPLPTVVLTSSDADNEICNGDAVTFTASGATNYEFFVDGGSVQASSTDNTYTTSALADGEVVTVEGIDANSCSATSSPINMTVNSLPVVTLSGSATEICAGDAVTYTAGGATNYEFFIDGISVQGPNTTATYTTSSLSNAQVVSVEGTDGNTCSATATEAAITVNSLPTVTLTSSEADNRICAGDAVTFTASGATDYEFFVDGLSVQASSTTATYTTSALADGEVVTVEGIDGNSCVATSSGITTSVDPLPTVVLTSSDADNEICNGDAVTFTASGATNYEFFVDGGSVQASSTDNTYTTSALADGEVVTVEGIDANSCSATSSPINMTVNSLPVVTLSGSATEICAGDAVTYTAGGATNYEFFIDGISVQGPNTNATYTTSSLSNAQVVSVEGTDGNTCSATATEAAITVNSLPTVTLTSSEADNRICAGDAVTFTASGATDYEFFVDGLSVQASSTTATYTTSALADGEVVTVEGIDGNSCVATSSGITTSVDPLPTVVLTSSDADNEICNGDAVTFTASGATNYEFFVDGGSVQASSTDNTYTTSALADGEVVTVEGIDANSCSATSSPINMTVNSLPVVTLSGSATEICAGDAVTYTAGGATNYEFFIDGISVQGPNTTATYTTSSLSNAQVVSVEGTDGNTCSATATEAAITVNSLPTVTLTSSEADNRICAGDAVTFTASGATDYEFFVDGLSVQASSTTATYTTSALADGEVVTVEGIDGNSCVATSSGITTSVDPLPTVVLTSSDADNEICNGDAVTFTASGATNYEFFVDGGSVQASSTDNTYTTSALADGEVVTVEGIDANSCSATSSPINMTVNSLPVVTLSGSATEICAGDAVTYTAGGATNYEFFIDGISVQGPNTNATYTTSSLSNAQVVSVEGTDGNTCSATATEAAITVNSLPTVTLTSSEADNRICAGDAVTFTASGATDYEFFVDGLSVQASSTTATYTTSALADGEVVTVEGIDGNSCVATSSGITTSVDPLPTVVLTSSDADNEICNGDAVTFTASGATNYEFFVDGGSVQASSTDNTYTTSALADGEVVTVEGIDANSCSATSSPINMTVNSLPVVTLSGSATEICAGDAVTYTAGGATNYEFFIDGISVQGPNTTATYTTSSLSNAQVVSVEGTDGNTCSATATEAAITVNSLPTVTLTSSEADNRICAGDAVTFTASGATDYEFFVDGLSVQASSTTATYTTSALADGEVVTVEGIDGNSCVATSSGITTSVDPIPNFSNLPSSTTICSGDQLNFTPTSDVAGTVFTWTVNAPLTITGETAGTGTIDDLLINSGNAIETVTYTLTATGPGPESCANTTTQDYVVTVNPTPVLTITNNEAIVCEGIGVDIDYSTPTSGGDISVQANYPTGVTGSIDYSTLTSLGVAGTITESLDNTTDSPQTVDYTFTVSGNGCPTSSETVSVQVNPTPTFSNLPTVATICSGQQLSFTPTSNVAGTVFTWTVNAPATITGEASGTGTIDDVLTNTGNAIETVTYTVTATGPGPESCANTTTQDYVVTVNPNPVQTITNNEAIVCEGIGVDIDYSTPTSGGDISVQANYPTGVTGSIDYSTLTSIGATGTITESLDNTTDSPQTVDYTFTVSGNGCPTSSETVSVQVNPTPTFTNLPATTDICSGEQLNFTPTSDVAGTVFTWTVNAPATITGEASGIGTIDDVLTNTGNAIETVTYTVTATGPGPESCANTTTQDYVVTVNPNPALTITNAAENICSGANTDITLSSNTANYEVEVTNITYNGVTVNSGDVTIGTKFSTTASIQEELENSTDNPIDVVYEFTISTTDGCPVSPMPQTSTVTVAPRPNMSITNALTSFCTGGSTDITLNSTESNAIIKLESITGTTGISGFTSVGVTFANGDNISDVLFNTTSSPVTITYNFSVSINGCDDGVANFSTDVTVNPFPNEPTATTINEFCVGDAAATTSVNTITGVNLKWYEDVNLNTPLATTSSSPSLSALNISTSSAGNFSRFVTQTDANTCESEPLEISIEIYDAPVFDPIPEVTSGNINVCAAELVDIDFSTSSSSDIISWTADNDLVGNSLSGNNSLTFLTKANNTASAIVTTITVEATNAGCSTPTTETFTITLNPTPKINNIFPPIEVCENSTIDLTTIGLTATPSDGTFTFDGPGINGSDFEATSAGLGIKEIDVTYTTLDNCSSTKSINLFNVVEQPSADLTSNTTTEICETETLDLVATISGGASSGTWTITGGNTIGSISSTTNNSGNWTAEFTPSGTNFGQVTAQFEAATANSCASEFETFVFDVFENPTATIPANFNTCGDASFNLNASLGGAANDGQWTVLTNGNAANLSGSSSVFGVTSDTYTPDAADYSSTITFQFEAFDPAAGPCGSTIYTVDVTIDKPAGIAITTAPANVCQNQTITISGEFSGSATSASWSESGFGSLSNISTVGNTVTADYNPTSADIGNTVTFTLSTNNPSNTCNSISETIDFVIDAPAQASITTSNTEICETETLDLVASISGGADSGTWSIVGGNTIGSIGTITNAGSDWTTTFTPSGTDFGQVTAQFEASTSNNCSSVIKTFVFDVFENPTASIPANFNTCGNASFDLDATLSGSAVDGQWTVTNNGIIDSLSASTTSGGITSATYTPAPGDYNAVITFQFTAIDPNTSGPCGNTNYTVDVTIDEPAEVAITTAPANVCQNQPISLSGNYSGSASSASWSITGGANTFSSTNIDNPTKTVTAVYNPTNDDVGNTITFTLTTDDPANTCGPVSEIVEFIIEEVPSANITTSTSEICQTETLDLVATISGGASSGDWTITNGGTIGTVSSTINNSGNYTATFSPSGTDFGQVTAQFEATTTNSCASEFETFVFDVFENPTASIPANFNTCGDASFNLDATLGGSANNGEWTVLTNGNSANLTTSTTTSGVTTANYTPDASDNNNTITFQFEVFDPVTGPCGNNTYTVDVTIDEPVEGTVTSTASAVCISEPITLAGTTNTSTSTGQWVIQTGQPDPDAETSGSLSTTSNNSGSYEATFTPDGTYFGDVIFEFIAQSNSSCANDIKTKTIKVRNLPAVADQAYAFCEVGIGSGNIELDLTAYNGDINNENGVTIEWFTNSGLTNAVVNETSETVNNNSTYYAKVTLNSTNCFDKARVDFTVDPQIILDAGSNEEICDGESLDLSTISTPPSQSKADNLSWTSSGDGTFDFPNSLTPIYTPGSTDLANSPITLTLTGSNSGQCNDEFDQLTLEIKPVPVISAISNVNKCSEEFVSIPVTTDLSDVNLSLSTDSDASFVFDNGPVLNGNNIEFTTAINTASVDYTSTITVNAEKNGCSSSITFDVTLKFKPVVSPESDLVLCYPSTVNPISFTDDTGGLSDFSWEITNPDLIGDGTSTTGTDDFPGFDLADNLTGAPVEGYVKYYSEYNGCLSEVDSFKITSNPRPVIQNSDITFCAGEEGVNITFLDNVTANTEFDWEIINSNNTVGINDLSGTDDSTITTNGFTAINNSSTSDNTAIIEVTSYLLDGFGNRICAGDPSVFNVTVLANPELTNPSFDEATCSNVTYEFIPESSVPTSDFIWSIDTAASDDLSNIEGLIASGTGDLELDLVNISGVNQDIVYTITPLNNNCDGISEQLTLTGCSRN